MAVVLVTGCSSGFGLEIALAFAREGDTVYASMRNPAKAGRLHERAAAEDLGVEVLALDVTDETSVREAVAQVEQRHGAVDVLVNNAGITYAGAVELTPEDHARQVFETNFWGALRTTRAALPAMRAAGRGTIVNISSLAGRIWSVPYGGFYAASKFALGSLSEALAAEVAPYGIRVVCLEPGNFATDVRANAYVRETTDGDPYAADEAWMQEFLSRASGESAGDPAELARAAVAAARDESTELHTLVGEEAHMMTSMIAASGTFEKWLPGFIAFAESVAGPRPAGPEHS
ncbi:SDR family oxidoreductase [Streptomyces sp. NPDC014995]|uniref:SDR family oxidoreductase n=1 Tax=Streptomyces sp. NPDC014995 TaxID=3364936 RepID=UPI0036FE25AD